MGHSHHQPGLGPGSAPSERANLRWMAGALAINAGFVVAEVVAGVLAHSLVLLSDAAHMLTDAAAIGLTLMAARLALREAKGAMTYGFKRAEILSAQTNGIALIILACFIVYAAIRRLISPPTVHAWPVLALGLCGVLVNGAAAAALARANRKSLNVESAFKHNLIDAYASVLTAIAAAMILLSSFNRADPIASLLIALPMLGIGGRLVWASGRIFLEAAPRDLDPTVIGEAMAAVQHVVEVHDLHVWEVTSGFPSLSAHVLVGRDEDCHQARRQLERLLRERFKIEHSTLQVEHEAGELISIQTPDAQ